MKKLHELHCRDGAGTVDIKNVNKALPLWRDRPILEDMSGTESLNNLINKCINNN